MASCQWHTFFRSIVQREYPNPICFANCHADYEFELFFANINIHTDHSNAVAFWAPTYPHIIVPFVWSWPKKKNAFEMWETSIWRYFHVTTLILERACSIRSGLYYIWRSWLSESNKMHFRSEWKFTITATKFR